VVRDLVVLWDYQTKVQELTDQCNLLERGEARYSRKLEKAKGKINKLKVSI
jgi:hypothetical protein